MESTTIRSVVRRMRGGSQSSLVEDLNGKHFIAKFLGNPQGARTLINECITSVLMKKLDICTPGLSLLHLPEVIRVSEHLSFKIGEETWLPHQGIHLGSECPVDLNKVAIWDFLPTSLLPKIVNLHEFGAAFVVDRWLNQTDLRQTIFLRDPSGESALFRAYFIDHGFAFSGSEWRLDNRRVRTFCQSHIYSLFDMNQVCKQTISKIESLSDDDLFATAEYLPECWFSEGDRTALDKLLVALSSRRSILRQLVFGDLEA